MCPSPYLELPRQHQVIPQLDLLRDQLRALQKVRVSTSLYHPHLVKAHLKLRYRKPQSHQHLFLSNPTSPLQILMSSCLPSALHRQNQVLACSSTWTVTCVEGVSNSVAIPTQ